MGFALAAPVCLDPDAVACFFALGFLEAGGELFAFADPAGDLEADFARAGPAADEEA